MSFYDPWQQLLNKVKEAGGFVNAHAHFDRAYTVSVDDIDSVVYDHLFEKWLHVDNYKKNASINDYCMNIKMAIDSQKRMGTTSCLSFIDVDSVTGLKTVRAAKLSKEYAESQS